MCLVIPGHDSDDLAIYPVLTLPARVVCYVAYIYIHELCVPLSNKNQNSGMRFASNIRTSDLRVPRMMPTM
jgi:hypothetical protein